MTTSPEGQPENIVIYGADGLPSSFIDGARLNADMRLLMHRLAAVAGDDDAVDDVARSWAEYIDQGLAPYVTAGALNLMVRKVVGPLVEMLETRAPDLKIRASLVAARDRAEAELGGGR